MDAQQFLADFGHIASAHGGIQCLREMIYNLAITGDLTQQFPDDGNAKTLLENIELTRQRLIQLKQFKRTSKLESEPLQVPNNVKLPTSWCWTRLLDIGEISPRNEAKDDDPAAFIPMSGIPQLHNGNLASEARTWGEIKKGFTHFANGDVVVAKITPCFENGKAAVITGLDNPRGIGAGTTELHVFRPIYPELLSTYVYIFLRSPFFAVEGENNMTGTAGQKRLPTEYFAIRAMPLPPFTEQVRIVIKVNELMALCDKLEVQQQQRNSLQSNIRHAAVQAVINSTSPNELEATWQRVSEEFEHIASAPEGIPFLRDLVLSLAITGKLTEHNKRDISARLMLEKLAIRRTQILDEQSISVTRKHKNLGVPKEAFQLPPGWSWEFLGYLSAWPLKDGDWIESKDQDPLGEIRIVQLADIGVGHYKNKSNRFITAQKAKKLNCYFLKVEDILIARLPDPLGRACIFPGDQKHCVTVVDIAVCRCDIQYIDPKYLVYCINSPFIRNTISSLATGTTRQRVATGQLGAVALPVPPIEEQARIVAKVQELMAFCDKLEMQLKHSKALARKLAIAATSAIIGISSEEEEELKTPKTELISKLRLVISPDIKEQAPLAAILARHHDEMPAGDLWQRYGGDIDAFYAQLKLEVGKGWIAEPATAEMRETEAG